MLPSTNVTTFTKRQYYRENNRNGATLAVMVSVENRAICLTDNLNITKYCLGSLEYFSIMDQLDKTTAETY